MTTKTKILIAEHDLSDLELLEYELKKGGLDYVVHIVDNEPDYINALKTFIPDLILSDFTFPSFSGSRAFKIRNDIAPDIPFIIVSGTIGEERSIELIKNGVTDYVLKESLFTINIKLRRALRDAKAKQQRKLAEEQKEFDSYNLNALINNTQDLMWSVDREFNLITSNEPFDNNIRLVTGNSIKKGSKIFATGFSPERVNRDKQFCERAFAGETFTEEEYRTTPTEMWSEVSYYPIRNENEILGTACHSRDITEAKRIKLQLERQNAELIKANSELDRFVYSTTHDLRSPLTSILGLVDIMEKETKEPSMLMYEGMIRKSISRLDDFIKNILSYSQNKDSELTVSKIQLQITIDEIVNSLRNMQEAEGIYFEFVIEEPHLFYSDLQRFSTILENLISNAIKYHKRDLTGRYIKIIAKSDMEHLHLSIEDNGIGIASIHHDKIFNMFYRLPSKSAGSGFGLYIVKEAIERLQGSITVNSEEEKGTSFNIILKNQIPANI